MAEADTIWEGLQVCSSYENVLGLPEGTDRCGVGTLHATGRGVIK